MKKTKVSIKDIATQLNISKTTVSFILNGKAKEKRISNELSEKVLKLVEEVGYKPNQLAQSLRTGKTGIIGLLVEDISNAFFANIAKNIEDIAARYHYKIIYCSTENSKEKTSEFLTMFLNLGVDGYIITPPGGIEEEVQALVDRGKEVVLFDRYFKTVDTDYVVVNNEEGTYTGTQHLIEQGYKNIAFITLTSRQSQMTARLQGYQKAVQEYNLTEIAHKLPYTTQNPESYTEKIIDIIKTEKSLDAILFATNYLGISGLDAMARLNIKIPQQIAVVSFDDNDLFRVYRPTITTIAQPIEKIAKTIISTLIDNIIVKKNSRDKKQIVLSSNLIIRDSSSKKQASMPINR